MSNFTQDFWTSRTKFVDGTTRIGQRDRLWYDPQTNTIRVGNGTPGGLIVSGGTGTGDPVEVQNDGVTLTTEVTVLNFATGLEATAVGNEITVNFDGSIAVGFTGSQGDTGFTGSQGPAGTSVNISGSVPDVGTDPQATLNAAFPGAVAGDGVIDQTTGDLWVYDGTTWDNVGQIRGFTGSQGDTGFAGSQGIQGIDGFTGSQGVQGDQGFTGSEGAQGPIGLTGSQGDIGFSGSEGAQGPIGLTGSQGDVGFVGSQGDQGFTGSEGAGFTGSQGIQGDQGFTGSQGDQGPAGTSVNIAGSVPDVGTDPQATLNAAFPGAQAGDGVIDETTGNLWVFDGTTWDDVGQIRGFTGSQGQQGIQGFAGSQGDIGFTGSEGAQGPIGLTGSQGDVGFTGSVGADGFTGSAGFTGSQGDTGFTGSEGVGFTGSQGDAGFAGSQGDIGFTGSQGAGADIDVVANTGLLLDNDELSTIYNTLIDDTIESIPVGGAASTPASVWKTRTLVEVLDEILFPDVDPTYTIPTISASFSQGGTREIGSTINQNITTTGVKNDAGEYTRLEIRRGTTVIDDVNDPTGSTTTAIPDQFGFPSPNNPNLSYSLSTTDTFVVVAGATSWNTRGNYDAGLAKNNNKGVPDARTPLVRNVNAPQAAANNFSSNTATVTGIFPYFWGVSTTEPSAADIVTAIESGNANRVLVSANGTVTVDFNADSEYVWLAHWQGFTTKTRWFVSELNQGDIGPNNFILSPVVDDVDSPDGFWTAIPFEIYISDFATVTVAPVQFRNS